MDEVVVESRDQLLAAARDPGIGRILGAASDALVVDAGTLVLRETEVHASDGAAIRMAGARAVELHDVRAYGRHGDVVVQA